MQTQIRPQLFKLLRFIFCESQLITRMGIPLSWVKIHSKKTFRRRVFSLLWDTWTYIHHAFFGCLDKRNSKKPWKIAGIIFTDFGDQFHEFFVFSFLFQVSLLLQLQKYKKFFFSDIKLQMSFIRCRPRRTFRSVLKMFKYFFFFKCSKLFFLITCFLLKCLTCFPCIMEMQWRWHLFIKEKTPNSRRSIHSIWILFPSQINNSSKMMRSSKMALLMAVNKFPSVLFKKCNVSMLLSEIVSLSLLREV